MPPKGLLQVAQAWAIRHGEGIPRWHLEAQLLTDEGVGPSATRCGLEPGVVEAYAMLYYDVLDRLHARDHIANRLLPPRAALGVRPDDVAGLLKLAAWKGGRWFLSRRCGCSTAGVCRGSSSPRSAGPS